MELFLVSELDRCGKCEAGKRTLFTPFNAQLPKSSKDLLFEAYTDLIA